MGKEAVPIQAGFKQTDTMPPVLWFTSLNILLDFVRALINSLAERRGRLTRKI